MFYGFIKTLHLTTVSFSLVLFILRGIWMLNNSNGYRKLWIRRTVQINDTILLICGIIMAVAIQQYPFVHAWLTAKLVLLVAYILLGMLALHWLHSKPLQLTAWLCAIGIYGYLIGIALNRDPLWLATIL